MKPDGDTDDDGTLPGPQRVVPRRSIDRVERLLLHQTSGQCSSDQHSRTQ
jgi:hypothetical protein